MTPLARLLIEAGLIHFGLFQHREQALPFSLHLDLLASYPAILDQFAREARALTRQRSISRVLCPPDAIPFGVAYALQTGIPLVYSQGGGQPPVDDLVGSYDIGHPTLLLTNSLGWLESPQALVTSARGVGLEVTAVLTILEARPEPIGDLPIVPLVRLADIVRDLAADGTLTSAFAQSILTWIAE